MLTVAIPKRNKLQNIIVLTPKDGKVGKSTGELKFVQVLVIILCTFVEKNSIITYERYVEYTYK